MNQDIWDDGSPIDHGIDRGQSSSRRKTRFSQRDAAVCRQAFRVLTTELMDVADASVQAIAPAPNASRLIVRIACPPGTTDDVQRDILARSGQLRFAVAAGLTRKKAPELVFVFVAEGGTHE